MPEREHDCLILFTQLAQIEAINSRYENSLIELFLCRSPSLSKSFESFKCIINEHPIFVVYFAVLLHRCRSCNKENRLRKPYSTGIQTNFKRPTKLRDLADGKCHLRISSLTSGNSSKFDVSSIDFTSTGMAAGRSRMCSQSTPRKNWFSFKSSKPFWDPNLLSASQQNLQKDTIFSL